ncbi:hypothetical protein [Dactylosporangium sp. NPDC000521]|uniref:hypothetical protein n=1 Tax=Dactylosporangium sp. NPDC000521 TaxID=3363975 RepID=UPI00368C7C6D
MTDDDDHFVVKGRRWRATDPAIPPEVAVELRQLLMAARRTSVRRCGRARTRRRSRWERGLRKG